MPKIAPIKGHNDSSFMIDNIPTRNFSQFKGQPGQPIIRKKDTSLYDSVVPIYEVNYDPQFSKSPLASVQMSKRAQMNRYGSAFEDQSEERSHVQAVYHGSQSEKCDWKRILCWLGIILGIVALCVGLYILVDKILGHKNTHNNTDISPNNSQEG